MKLIHSGSPLTRLVSPGDPISFAFKTGGGNPVNQPPKNTVKPVVSGDTTLGGLLACTTGTWTGEAPITYAYQWLRDGIAISGQTNSTHTVVQADEGHSISCTVYATDIHGTSHATSNAVSVIDPTVLYQYVNTSDINPPAGRIHSTSNILRFNEVDKNGNLRDLGQLVSGDSITVGTQTATLTADPIFQSPVWRLTVDAWPMLADGDYICSAEKAGNWTPLDLFLFGEEGFWFDGSDFSTMFKDSSGSVPVTAVGDAVSYWENKISGQQVSRISATDTRVAPLVETYNTDKLRLTWDGSNDRLAFSSPNLSQGGAITFAIGFRKAQSYSGALQPYRASGTGSALQNVQVQGNNTVIFQTFGQMLTSVNAISNETMNIGLMWAQQNTTSLNIDLNGVTAALGPVPTNGAIAAAPTLPNVAASVRFSISQIVLVNRVLTVEERDQLKAFIASKH